MHITHLSLYTDKTIRKTYTALLSPSLVEPKGGSNNIDQVHLPPRRFTLFSIYTSKDKLLQDSQQISFFPMTIFILQIFQSLCEPCIII